MRNLNKYGLFLLVGLLFLSCSKEDDFEIDNLNNGLVMVLGHRGMGELYKYPGNTAESVLPVLGIGADGAELDLQMTKDSVLVFFHNKTLNGRTTFSGTISERNWDELKGCKYANTIADIPLYSVDSLFGMIDNIQDYYFSFDCKYPDDTSSFDNYEATFLRAVERINQKYQMSENIIIEADFRILDLISKLGLKNKICLLGLSGYKEAVDYAAKKSYFCIGASVGGISKEEVKYAHSQGVRVMVWSVKNVFGNREAIEKNVDIIQTDAPIQILQQFKRYNFQYRIP